MTSQGIAQRTAYLILLFSRLIALGYAAAVPLRSLSFYTVFSMYT